jgi:hypothetical protein
MVREAADGGFVSPEYSAVLFGLFYPFQRKGKALFLILLT